MISSFISWSVSWLREEVEMIYNPGILVWDSMKLHSGKLTRQWKIPISNREYIFKKVHFPLPCWFTRGHSFWKQIFPIQIFKAKCGRQAGPHWRLVLGTLNLNGVQYPGLLIILKGKYLRNREYSQPSDWSLISFTVLPWKVFRLNHGNPSYPPQSYPPRNKALLRVINHWFPLIRPY